MHETNPWTRHAPFSILVLLFLSGVVITTPAAQSAPAAFVFEEITSLSASGPMHAGTMAVAWVNSDVVVMAYESLAVRSRRCVLSTETCSDVSILPGSTAARNGLTLQRFGGSGLLVCAVTNAAGVDTYWAAYSLNGGLTWSTATAIMTGTQNTLRGASCASTTDGSAFVAVSTFDSAGEHSRYSFSIDGGLSWSSPAEVPGAPTSAGVLHLATGMLNETRWLLAFGTTSTDEFMRTTDTTIWTDGGSLAGSGDPSNQRIATVEGNLNDILISTKTDVQVLLSQNGGASFSISTNPNAQEGGTQSSEALWLGENHIGVATAQSGTIDEPCWFSQTDDFLSWTDQALFDIGADVALSSGGTSVAQLDDNIAIACGYQTVAAPTVSTIKVFVKTGVGAAVLPTTSISVSGLVGFDVDRTGGLIITREGSGTTVSTYSALSLANLASTSTADCSRSDGVMAIASMVMYVQCTAGNVVDSLEIKGPTLGAPTWPPGCDFCPDSIGIADYDHDEVREVKDLIRFPIDRSEGFSDSSFFSSGRADAAWGFSTEDNFVGVMTHTARDDSADGQFTASVAYGTGVGAEQLCVGQLSEGAEPYMTAVDTASPTRSWDLDFSIGASGGFPVGELEVELANALIYTSAYGSAAGVDCAGNRVAVSLDRGASDEILVFQKTDGGLLWRTTLGDVAAAVVRGVTISGNAEFVAYVSEQSAGTATEAKVAYASNGTVIMTVTPPSGLFHSMSIDHTGANLWIATTTLINRYDISIATGASGTIPTGPPAGVNGDVPVVFGGQEVAGLGGFGTNLFLGVMMVAGMTVTMAGAPSMVAERQLGFNRFLAIIGAILGVLLAWAFGLFSNGVIFTIVVLAGLVTVFWIRSR